MGRNSRNKNRKKGKIANQVTSAINIGCQPSLVRLVLWMKDSALWTPTCKLQPSIFCDTGRGMMACQDVAVGDLLVSIPQNLLITTSTVLTSDVKVVFMNSTSTDSNFPSAQQVLSTFIALECKKGRESNWYEYLATIPRTFTTPLFCNNQEILPDYVRKQVDKVKENLKHSFDFVAIQIKRHGLPEITWEEYLWAWYAVNSRAVYLEPNETCNIIQDKDCLALAPYLDLLNHSARIPVNQVRLHNGQYELRSSANFKKYDQVFISYGAHNNVTLCLEYGFVVADNPNDFVSISQEDVYCATDASFHDIEPQGELFCTREGLSWSALTLISKCLNIESQEMYSNKNVKESAIRIINTKIEMLQSDLSDHYSSHVISRSGCSLHTCRCQASRRILPAPGGLRPCGAAVRGCFHPGASQLASLAGDLNIKREVTAQEMLKGLLSYIWPKDDSSIKKRVVVSLSLLASAKMISVCVPFLFKCGLDTLNGTPPDVVVAFTNVADSAATVAATLLMALPEQQQQVSMS
ncbi:hypothetical protein B566_EDAN016298 [Ephemera danica]|nr:hypothetical protein B566_EDAN016298 [Ephemera danica]